MRASPLLKEASSSLVQEVLLKLEPFTLVAGEWLYHAGDVGRDAVFVRTGTLQVVETSHTGTAVVTDTATAGSLLGESSLFVTPSLRSSSVKAVTDVELFRCARRNPGLLTGTSYVPLECPSTAQMFTRASVSPRVCILTLTA